MLTLTLDTALKAEASFVEDGEVLGSASETAPRRHAEDLAGIVEKARKTAGLNAPLSTLEVGEICVGTGPGSFTALRAGLAFATSLSFGLNVPAYGVSSLAGYARGAFDSYGDAENVLVITDARRKEVFWARYEPLGKDDVQYVLPPAVGPLEDALAQRGVDLFVVDEALMNQPETAARPSQTDTEIVILKNPSSAPLARIVSARLAKARKGGAEAHLPVEPMYLRRPDVNVPNFK